MYQILSKTLVELKKYSWWLQNVSDAYAHKINTAILSEVDVTCLSLEKNPHDGLNDRLKEVCYGKESNHLSVALKMPNTNNVDKFGILSMKLEHVAGL